MSGKKPVFILVWDRLPGTPGAKLKSMTCDGFLLYTHDGKGHSDLLGHGAINWTAFAEQLIRSGDEEIMNNALIEAKKRIAQGVHKEQKRMAAERAKEAAKG